MNNVTEVEKGKVYSIRYNVPKELKDTLNILIEQELGDAEVCVLNDLSKLENGRIIGEVLIEFFNDFNADTLYSKAKQFELLSNGQDLITL